ncbi:RNA polymerase sigma factor [Brevundimonas denitrificans]|uniref:RNA polymerase sigma factor n=1 Tax=Brevundimonas denitrificans TaxID=1443434 RepID=UPI00223BFC41|nr:sigma-70 family RNA polymerase sigma factor [Brevundimonas denitrificans]
MTNCWWFWSRPATAGRASAWPPAGSRVCCAPPVASCAARTAPRDAVQDAWTSIFRGVARLNDPAAFPAWAFGILNRRCVDRIRGDSRRAEAVVDVDQVSAPSPAETEGLDLVRALAGLDHDHRTAAVLHLCEGLTLAEVAAAVGVPLGTAKSRIFHARRRLKAALSGDT